MNSIVITESALREFLREMLDSPSTNSHLDGNMPVRISPVVAPDAAEVNSANSNFTPQNKVELLSALRTICNVEDDQVPAVYIAVKDALEKQGEEMKNTQVESTIRATVRKLLSEISASEKRQMAADKLWSELPKVDPSTYPQVTKVDPGVSSKSGTPAEQKAKFEKNKSQLQKTFSTMKMSDLEDEAESEPTGRKNVMMTDVGGSSFKEIAKELGFAAESGAKQAVEKALEKAKLVTKMDLFDPDTLEILVLQSMSDYIDVLSSTGELTPQEVKMLKDNPAIVRTLDGFREFLDKDLRKAKKTLETAKNESRLRGR
jgi:hypothetical protein